MTEQGINSPEQGAQSTDQGTTREPPAGAWYDRQDAKRRRSCTKAVASATPSGKQWANTKIREIVIFERQARSNNGG
jgi:hypothetical protein